MFFVQHVEMICSCDFPEIDCHSFKHQVFIQHLLHSSYATEHSERYKSSWSTPSYSNLRSFYFLARELMNWRIKSNKIKQKRTNDSLSIKHSSNSIKFIIFGWRYGLTCWLHIVFLCILLPLSHIHVCRGIYSNPLRIYSCIY